MNDYLRIMFSGWITQSTKMLSISFNLYNMATDLASAVDVIFEISNTGFIHKKVKIYNARFFDKWRSSDI